MREGAWLEGGALEPPQRKTLQEIQDRCARTLSTPVAAEPWSPGLRVPEPKPPPPEKRPLEPVLPEAA